MNSEDTRTLPRTTGIERAHTSAEGIGMVSTVSIGIADIVDIASMAGTHNYTHIETFCLTPIENVALYAN